MMKLNSNSGLTLIEVIIAIAILGILTLSLISSFVVGFDWITNAGDRSRDVFDAQQILEQELIQGGTATVSNMDLIFNDSDGNPILQHITMDGEDINEGSLWLFIPESN